MGFDDDDDNDDRKAIIEALFSRLVRAWGSRDASYVYQINYLRERVLSWKLRKSICYFYLTLT